MGGMDASAGFGFTTLGRPEAERALEQHPELADPDSANSVVLMLSARDDSEAAELADVLAVVRAVTRSRNQSARAVLQVLLPEERLTTTPSVLTQLRRNAEAQKALADEFGLLSSAEVAVLAGSKAANSAALASRWRTKGLVFAVPVDGDARYPGFQFDPAGKPLPVIAGVLHALGDHLSGWELALWFSGSNDWLGGSRPVDVLAGPPADHVVVEEAAQRLADELAA